MNNIFRVSVSIFFTEISFQASSDSPSTFSFNRILSIYFIIFVFISLGTVFFCIVFILRHPENRLLHLPQSLHLFIWFNLRHQLLNHRLQHHRNQLHHLMSLIILTYPKILIISSFSSYSFPQHRLGRHLLRVNYFHFLHRLLLQHHLQHLFRFNWF